MKFLLLLALKPFITLAYGESESIEKEATRLQAEEDKAERALVVEDEKRKAKAQSPLELDEKAPRDANGELILRRREIHSGRAISVSTVEWSVAEKRASPTSVLEGFMWEKEAEVDRFRERVPLANLVSQCRLSSMDPTKAKPRDWRSSTRLAISEGDGFVVIPEFKRIEPSSGSLRKRYDLPKLVKTFTVAGASSLSVNCDGILFGGSLDDLEKAREASSSAAVAIADSDGVVVPPLLGRLDSVSISVVSVTPRWRRRSQPHDGRSCTERFTVPLQDCFKFTASDSCNGHERDSNQ